MCFFFYSPYVVFWFSYYKIIRKLGGDVTLDGNMSTHIVTGKVRKTLNLCTALCSGLVSKLTYLHQV